MAGNFSNVIKLYLASETFAKLAPATQYNWKRALTLAEVAMGQSEVDLIRPSISQRHLDALAEYPGKQSIAKTALQALEKWALVRDLLRYPIMTGTQTIGSDGGHEPWSDEQVMAAELHARKDISRVITLAVNTGQRGSDIVKMRWSDITERDGREGVEVTQKKTGRRLWVPFTNALSAKMATWEKAPPFFLVLAPDGRQFTRNRLSHDWTNERDTNPHLTAHKAIGLVLHGLRATAVVRLRKAGASELEISSMIGMSEPMVARYSRLANQNKMAMAAISRLEDFKALQTNPLKSKDRPL